MDRLFVLLLNIAGAVTLSFYACYITAIAFRRQLYSPYLLLFIFFLLTCYIGVSILLYFYKAEKREDISI